MKCLVCIHLVQYMVNASVLYVNCHRKKALNYILYDSSKNVVYFCLYSSSVNSFRARYFKNWKYYNNIHLRCMHVCGHTPSIIYEITGFNIPASYIYYKNIHNKVPRCTSMYVATHHGTLP